MSVDVANVIDGSRIRTDAPGRELSDADLRARLARVAQEFESMLLVQMLRDMRASGQWLDDGDEDTLGAETMFEALDVELASHLARVQGLGLSTQLLTAFDRLQPAQPGAAVTRAASTAVESAPTALAPPAPRVVDAFSNVSAQPPLVSQPSLQLPSGHVTSGYGWRSDPLTGQTAFHRGIDVRAAYGDPVHAAADGTVVFSGEQGGYGTTVVLEHANGTRTRYAHLSADLVAVGDAVTAGETIGRAGRSGRATATHLHFELIGADGAPMDLTRAQALGVGHGA